MLNEKVSFEDAIKAYEKAIEINPDYDTAYYNMGIAYAKLDKLSPIVIRFNLNDFFIGLNCLLKLIFLIIPITF
jgi:tetratricopeptide (TPR) repeat protein